eukprot:45450-Amphidinium_carterae.2
MSCTWHAAPLSLWHPTATNNVFRVRHSRGDKLSPWRAHDTPDSLRFAVACSYFLCLPVCATTWAITP